MNKELQEAWEKRLALVAEGWKLFTEGGKSTVVGEIICPKIAKLLAKGWKLQSDGELLWKNAVIGVHGKDMTMTWVNWNEEKKSYECHLGNGEVYKP